MKFIKPVQYVLEKNQISNHFLLNSTKCLESYENSLMVFNKYTLGERDKKAWQVCLESFQQVGIDCKTRFSHFEERQNIFSGYMTKLKEFSEFGLLFLNDKKYNVNDVCKIVDVADRMMLEMIPDEILLMNQFFPKITQVEGETILKDLLVLNKQSFEYQGFKKLNVEHFDAQKAKDKLEFALKASNNYILLNGKRESEFNSLKMDFIGKNNKAISDIEEIISEI